MKAIALTRYLPIDDPQSLVDVELSDPPAPTGHDLLVRVEAVSVNPVDTKVRSPKPQVEAQPKVLGYGRRRYRRSRRRQGHRLQPGRPRLLRRRHHATGQQRAAASGDARIAPIRRRRWTRTQAAALPLTVLTAWELLFQRMPFDSGNGGKGKTLLIIAGAGGVGSVAIQLAHRAGFTVIATASREDTIAWCRELGAHHVIDHRQPLAPQLSALGFDVVDAALNLYDTSGYWEQLGEVLAPQGHVGLVVEPKEPVRLGDPYKFKCIGIHWEMMFGRPRFQTADMDEQGRILDRVAKLIDSGELRGTHRDTLSPINAENLREAHRRLESGTTIGKLVLTGW